MEDFNQGALIVITVTSAMGEDQVTGYRKEQEKK